MPVQGSKLPKPRNITTEGIPLFVGNALEDLTFLVALELFLINVPRATVMAQDNTLFGFKKMARYHMIAAFFTLIYKSWPIIFNVRKS